LMDRAGANDPARVRYRGVFGHRHVAIIDPSLFEVAVRFLAIVIA